MKSFFLFNLLISSAFAAAADETSIARSKKPNIILIYAPGMTKQGKQDILVSMADMLPTVAEIAKVKLPDDFPINGKSLVPFLFSEEKEHRDFLTKSIKPFDVHAKAHDAPGFKPSGEVLKGKGRDFKKAFIDGELITKLKSPGIDHPTKSKLGMTVNGTTIDFDNFKVFTDS